MKKGRNSELIELRDKKLIERFVYWYVVCKVRLDETLRILSREEFFISEQRIWNIVKNAKGALSEQAVCEVKKPKVRAIRGVPTSVRCVAEYSYSLFPASSPSQ